MRRGFASSSSYPLCLCGEETILHLLRDCSKVVPIWGVLAQGRLKADFFSDDLQLWLASNMKKNHLKHGLKWSLIFGVAVSCFWMCRNEVIFQDKVLNCHDMLRKILGTAGVIHLSWKEFSGSSNCCFNFDNRLATSWTAPASGFVKLNCDGAVCNLGANAAMGGILHSSSGSFLFAYASKLQEASVVEAELYAIFTGLKLSREKSFSNILVESDSLSAVRLVNLGCPHLHPNSNLVGEIQKLMSLDGGTTVTHVPREVNGVADCFAKGGLSLSTSNIVYDQLPSFAVNAFVADLAGVSCPRGF